MIGVLYDTKQSLHFWKIILIFNSLFFRAINHSCCIDEIKMQVLEVSGEWQWWFLCSPLWGWLCWISPDLHRTSVVGGGIDTDYPAAAISVGVQLRWWLLEQIPHYGIWEWNQRTAVTGVWKLHLELAFYRKKLDTDWLGGGWEKPAVFSEGSDFDGRCPSRQI